MVIYNGYVGRTLSSPPENDAPLVVYANGVEASPIALEGFEPVAWWHGHVFQTPSTVQLNELSQGDARDGREAAVLFGTEKFLSVGVGVGLDHATYEANAGVGEMWRQKAPARGGAAGLEGTRPRRAWLQGQNPVAGRKGAGRCLLIHPRPLTAGSSGRQVPELA